MTQHPFKPQFQLPSAQKIQAQPVAQPQVPPKPQFRRIQQHQPVQSQSEQLLQQQPVQPFYSPKPRKMRTTSRVVIAALIVIVVGVAITRLVSSAIPLSQLQRPQKTVVPTKYAGTNTGTNTSLQHQQTPVSQSTTINTITATYGTPRIGGPISDFVGEYGQPDSSKSRKEAYVFFDSEEYNVLTVTTRGAYVIANLINGNNKLWNEAAATSACVAFAPPDSVYDRETTVPAHSGNLVNLQKVYYSAFLSSQLPANDFKDEDNRQVKPGTFSIVLNYATTDTAKILTCTIQVGIQQK